MFMELTRRDVLNMLLGTGGPGTYEHPFEFTGTLRGFPNERWEWNHKYLDSLSKERLWLLYKDIMHFKDKQTSLKDANNR